MFIYILFKYILFWILTIAFSVVSDINLHLKMIKDFADDGYLLKTGNSNRERMTINDYFNIAIYFIPLLNIMRSFFLTISYQNIKVNTFFYYDMLGEIERMTPIEKEMYQKNPTAVNAYLLKIIVKNRISNAGRIYIQENFGYNNDVGVVYFEYDSSKDDIHIIEREGCAKRYSDIAIKNFLDKANIHITYNKKDICIYLDEIYSKDEANNTQLKKEENNTKALDEATLETLNDNTLDNSANKGYPYVYKK